MAQRPKARMPTWRWPNVHEWALVGFFLLTYEILRMVRINPALLGVPSFMQFASQLVGGGLLLAAAWLYSAGKGATKPAPVEIVNDTARPVPVEETAVAPGADEVKT